MIGECEEGREEDLIEPDTDEREVRIFELEEQLEKLQ